MDRLVQLSQLSSDQLSKVYPKMKKGGNFSGKGRSFSGKGRSFSGGVKRKTVMKRREQGSYKKGGFAEINSDQMLKLCPLSSPTQPRHFLSLLPLFLSLSFPPNGPFSLSLYIKINNFQFSLCFLSLPVLENCTD